MIERLTAKLFLSWIQAILPKVGFFLVDLWDAGGLSGNI